MARDMVQVRRTNAPRQRPDVKIGRSQFNRSHGRKVTFDASYIYPILVDEVLPGDTFTLKTTGFARIFSPLDAPVMDNIEVETFFFFVPNRLVWDNWAYFMGEHDAAGAQDTTYTIPVLDTGLTVSHANGTGAGHFAAHMGLPHGLATANNADVNVLPFRGYNRVYNEWFRDQNVTAEITMYSGNGPDSSSVYVLRKSAKKPDYFTTCLPYLQKGTAQDLFGGVTTVNVQTAAVAGNTVTVVSGSGQRDLDSDAAAVDVSASNTGSALFVDLSDLSVDINQLRQSLAIQRLLEKDARGGTRYVEMIKAHFGVVSPDYRLQRTEYLGGGKSYINISPVANASGVDSTVSVSGADEPQGTLRGVGTGMVTGGFAKSFTEHGYILGLIRARGDLTYFQGLDRMWTRSDRYDFYFPDLAGLSEQAVLNQELFVSGDANDAVTFGYQQRWEEYRIAHSKIIGELNPDVSGAISHWHLAEDFGSLPTLNTTFIEDQTPMSRVTTVDTEADFLADLWFDYKCARPLPVYGIPSILGARF